MIDIMNWERCKEEFITNTTPDKEKINSITSTAKKRLEFTKKLEINNESVSFIVEQYYEIIKELLTALLLKNGLRSKNHQCLISYFHKNYPNYDYEAKLISQMCYLRNKLEYYGELIEIEFYNKNKLEFEHIINILIKNIKK